DQGLNMLNAGILLGFMAIPTMFTLAEDALNNVPKSYTEASLALGASKLHTVFKVIVPCAISGIIAAVLLGFGRIIGETMVVLLVAGGRIALPETWTDPVHTMTGIIAQETGEVTAGSIHFRALFMVGLVLFTISLVLNSLAQNVVKKFSHR
ncbi:MAG: PstC family ABC transporter permease, partial [Akkermansiaceae bacterium]